MVCQRGGFIIQRNNEQRNLEAEMLKMVCNDVEVEPVLQEVTGETLNHGANKAPDARLDIHARGFWERQRSVIFNVRVCHPNADSYRDLTPKQIYKKHENEKKRQYAERVMEIELRTFTPLVFTTKGGMADECVKYHSRLAELIANEKGESYSSAISWIRAKVSFAIIRSTILLLKYAQTATILNYFECYFIYAKVCKGYYICLFWLSDFENARAGRKVTLIVRFIFW